MARFLDSNNSNLLGCVVRPKHNHPASNLNALDFSACGIDEIGVCPAKRIGRKRPESPDKLLAMLGGQSRRFFNNIAIKDISIHLSSTPFVFQALVQSLELVHRDCLPGIHIGHSLLDVLAEPGFFLFLQIRDKGGDLNALLRGEFGNSLFDFSNAHIG